MQKTTKKTIMDNKNIKQSGNTPKNEITRKEAIKKAGKYAAITAASMFMVLSPKQSQAISLTPPPGWWP